MATTMTTTMTTPMGEISSTSATASPPPPLVVMITGGGDVFTAGASHSLTCTANGGASMTHLSVAEIQLVRHHPPSLSLFYVKGGKYL